MKVLLGIENTNSLPLKKKTILLHTEYSWMLLQRHNSLVGIQHMQSTQRMKNNILLSMKCSCQHPQLNNCQLHTEYNQSLPQRNNILLGIQSMNSILLKPNSSLLHMMNSCQILPLNRFLLHTVYSRVLQQRNNILPIYIYI
mgnify:CR=1 FL=1